MGRLVSDLQLFVDRLASHSDLGRPEREAILSLPTTATRLDANRDLVRLGDTVSHACIVVEGVLGGFGQTSEGARQITAIFVPGDAPDLHSVILPKASTALQALTASTILRVPHAALRSAANRFPAVAEAFWRDCAAHAAISAQWVINIGRRDARARLAHLLCEFAMRMNARTIGGEVVFPFPLTQTQLADAAGLTPVHVNRMMTSLSRDKLVSVEHRSARIFDWATLAKAGDFEADYLILDAAQERAPALQASTQPAALRPLHAGPALLGAAAPPTR